eukprot:1140423-Pelagomonas_calceolata.AAC.5
MCAPSCHEAPQAAIAQRTGHAGTLRCAPLKAQALHILQFTGLHTPQLAGHTCISHCVPQYTLLSNASIGSFHHVTSCYWT